jgi:wyosine [tRNA(Phe)-imidazoG37] synthetase (radical SAM superfamily)
MENVASLKGPEGAPGTVATDPTKPAARVPQRSAGDALGSSRRFFDNRFVYAVVSQRSRGLSIGVNLSPDKFCTFDCVYCEVSRTAANGANGQSELDLKALSTELRKMLGFAAQGRMHELPGYQNVPQELLNLKSVALSGDGEPTLCPSFHEAVQVVVHLRAQGEFPFFKIVLITNASGLHLPQVQLGLQLLTAQDEVWAKLDAGTQSYMEKVNRPKVCPVKCPNVSLANVLENLLKLGKQRPIVIQSLFALLDGEEPPPEEIEQYVQRLKELRQAGANISLVQVYSAHRPSIRAVCGHLPLRSLSRIAQRVREVTGLKAEVF